MDGYDRSYRVNTLALQDIESYLEVHQHKTLLRFITCGSVDDGKSTLIGRLLYDSKLIFEDQLAALEADSKRVGTQGQNLDFALLVDGLAAEREQGITIDVAYRFFATERRKFIVADTPGHEQYTRNMVTGASTADLAVILVDARHGVLTQTRRHSYLAHLVGIRNIVVAVNKLDLLDWDHAVFEAIINDYGVFASSIGIEAFTAIPISALHGDNIATPSTNTAWYDGPTLLDHLEQVELDASAMQQRPFRMPVQWVNRPNLDFRGFSGLIASGRVRPGDSVSVQPNGRRTAIERIVSLSGDLDEAVAGESVTLTFADEIDCSRGDVLVATAEPASVADQFEATLVWMDEVELLPGRPYWLKLGTQKVSATVQSIKHQVSVNTLERLAAKTLQLNAIGVTNIATDRPVVFERYADDKSLGGFVLIDKLTHATAAAGLIHHALRRADNVHWQSLDVSPENHARLKAQRPAVIWLTGVSGAGKSELANAIEKKLAAMQRHTFLLDGDNIRQSLSRDLGFTDADRVENIRRVGAVAKLMADAGLIVITSFISPFRAERQMAREMMGGVSFYEIFVDTPLELAEARDAKGLYGKARAGLLRNFTGVDSPYEPPERPELRVDTTQTPLEAAADQVLRLLGFGN